MDYELEFAHFNIRRLVAIQYIPQYIAQTCLLLTNAYGITQSRINTFMMQPTK